MTRLIVVFGTTTIVSHRPVFSGQEPVYEDPDPRYGYQAWSTGKLENALASGHDVYVCTVIPRFRPEDAWWRLYVPPERIYAPAADARGTVDQIKEHFIEGPWRRFLADIGRPWPEGIDDILRWRESLDGSGGVLYGGHLAGFAGSA